ncbi:hypothetical protein FB566_5002 [Stackebrandtia endophytica]|uniref:Uncharacterized protein n=1 Tax=Stackebrandtia endophytica TaxID=1496996 RepID=A0A543B3R1_9ACTN|nr:hypothetical protein [Stackebrandtia endophytica]TQL79400.1 hypothetical protein FB566_5002 [Stackebrandtia endophytica]
MREIVHLDGDDRDVITVARAAARVIRPDRDTRRALFPQLMGLHRGRRSHLAAPTVPVAGRSAPARVWIVVWGILLTSGLVAASMAAVALGPPGRRNASTSADQAMAVAVPAAAIAIPLLLVVLFLPVPRGKAARYGTVATVPVAVMVAGLLVFRLLVGTEDSRGFSAEQVGLWLRLTLVVFVTLVVLGWRLNRLRRRRSDDPRPDSRDAVATMRHLRRTAVRLAETSSGPPDVVLGEWTERLNRLAKSGVNAETIAQARTMSPVAWLVWTFYDGEIDVSDVLPKS